MCRIWAIESTWSTSIAMNHNSVSDGAAARMSSLATSATLLVSASASRREQFKTESSGGELNNCFPFCFAGNKPRDHQITLVVRYLGLRSSVFESVTKGGHGRFSTCAQMLVMRCMGDVTAVGRCGTVQILPETYEYIVLSFVASHHRCLQNALKPQRTP